ncbi:hypothetical protein [Brytella acorum]|uniref:Uncharacterized protein n=1 Tax=Brytella acorum TaxID=2959299 RepID=A0AA35Y3X7_9PROT|nr:hypothetical protein [Brytella acorum]MDF3624111.1 hypothetical protein [Brytella acorum]CAI9120618.1 hypothetical protein LMG32879_001454 [Brytella acorum]
MQDAQGTLANKTGPDTADRKKSERKLKSRFIGMVAGLFLAHAYVALALHYTYMDSHNYFHTSYIALFGALLGGLLFCWHIGIS